LTDPNWKSISGQTGIEGLNANIQNFVQQNPNIAYPQINAAAQQYGVDAEDIRRAVAAGGGSGGLQNVLTQADWRSRTGLTGLEGMNKNIQMWFNEHSKATEDQIRQAMQAVDINEADVVRAMGKSVKDLAYKEPEKKPVTAVSPTFTETDTGTTVTPAPLPVLPDFAPTTPTLTPPTQFTPQTMEQVRTAYEQGGGATEMPTVTRLGPNERVMTQNAVVDALQAYLANNPNATATEITAWGRANGVPDYQLRAAINERRFSMLTGGSKNAYDYLMGRGAYPTTPFVPGGGPLMRPYSEVVGGAAGESAIRRYVPPAPSRQTAQGAQSADTGTTRTTGGTTTGGGVLAPSGVTGGGTSTAGGTSSAMLMGTTGGGTAAAAAGPAGTAVNPEVGPTQRYTPVSGTPITDFLFGTQDASTVPVVERGIYTDSAMRELLANEAALNERRAEVEDVLNVEQIQRDILRAQEEAYLQRQLEIARAAEETGSYDFGPFDSEYDVGGPNYTDEELDLLAGMRKGGLAAIAAGAARGGQFNLGGYSDGGRLLRGPGDGVSDSIPATIGNRQPARLADGEFVIPARIVSEIGNGSTEAGARKLYAMMDRVQRARAKTTGKGKVAKNTRADKYLPA
jgi:hypothetical protein